MDVAQPWQEASVSLAKLSSECRLAQRIEGPGGDARWTDANGVFRGSNMDVAQQWQEALASLARLSPGQRTIRLLEAPGGDPPAVLGQLASEAIVERFSGREAVCEGFRFEIAVLSSSAELDLAPLLGQPLGLRLEGPYKQLRCKADPL
ncbi:hypothetical protein WCE37_03750 [Luteimonas sp. MJ250]|uniref:hypothetical protein n=1 Tax=Luteimonas sp. MJ250 TaxID=3129236 RepID=UPI0031B9E12D